MGYPRKLNGFIGDDNPGGRETAPQFGGIGLCLGGIFAVKGDRGRAQNNAGQDRTLTAHAGDGQIGLRHYLPSIISHCS